MTANLVMWNYELWSGNKNDLAKLDAFHHKSIRRILNIRMKAVEEVRMSNRKLRRRFGGMTQISEMCRYRMLNSIRRTMHQDEHMLPKLFLCAHIKGSVLNGRPFRKNNCAIVESLRMLMPSIPESVDCEYWIGYTCNKLEWKEWSKTEMSECTLAMMTIMITSCTQ